MLSQHDIVRYLYHSLSDHKGKLEKMGAKTLEQLSLSTKRVYTADTTDSVQSALAMMRKQGISALGIVDPHKGRLTGNFSASDVRFFFHAMSEVQ